MTKTIYDKLKEHAKKNPEGFTVEIVKGKLKSVKHSVSKRYVISKTNYNTSKKQKAGFKDVKSGIAGGWYDTKSKRYYIDKNLIVGKESHALRLAVKHRQKAVFDLKEFKEIRTPTATKDRVVVKVKGKFFNTITGKYVAKSTAKRYNSYFKRNPDALLFQAYGDYKYSRGIALDKLSRKTVKLFYSDDQVIKTKDIKGKTVHYSPIQKSEVKKEIVKKFEKLDYRICDNRVQVKLYRLTRNNKHVCHVFRWDINKNWYSVFGLEDWINNVGIPVMNCILNEVHKVANKYRIGKIQSMYGHIQCGYYSDIDSFPANRVFGMGYQPHKITEIKEFAREYKDLLRKALYKIESDAYRNFYLENITIYIYTARIHGINDQIAMHRMGVLGIMRKE